MNSEEFIKFQAAQQEFAKQQVELYMRYLDLDTCAGHSAADVEKGNRSTKSAWSSRNPLIPPAEFPIAHRDLSLLQSTKPPS